MTNNRRTPYFSVKKLPPSLSRGEKRRTRDKRIVKFLSVTEDPKIQKLVLQKAPDSIIKAISNAAINAAKGDIKFTTAEKKILAKHRLPINTLISRKTPITTKRKVLSQRGKGLLGLALPIILSSVLSAIGNKFFPGNNSNK